MHFFAWEKGLKTGCYYLRTKPKTEAIKFSLMEDQAVQRFQEKDKKETKYTKNGKTYTCTDDVCTSCSA